MRCQGDMVRSRQQVTANMDSKAEVLVDARANGRFIGRDPEPRPGLPSGHIPGSLNVPFTEVVHDGRCALKLGWLVCVCVRAWACACACARAREDGNYNEIITGFLGCPNFR